MTDDPSQSKPPYVGIPADMTPEQTASFDAYWAARTPEDERAAYARMTALGFPDAYASEANARPDPTTPIDERVAELEAQLATCRDIVRERDDDVARLMAWNAALVARVCAAEDKLVATPEEWERLRMRANQRLAALPGADATAAAVLEAQLARVTPEQNARSRSVKYKRVIVEQGAVDDTKNLMAELAKPDGVIQINHGFYAHDDGETLIIDSCNP